MGKTRPTIETLIAIFKELSEQPCNCKEFTAELCKSCSAKKVLEKVYAELQENRP
jgi:hypothetical protein